LPRCYIIKIRRPLRIRRLPYFLAYKESQISQKPSVQALYFLYPPAFYNRPWPYRREVSDSPRKNKAVEVFLLINIPAGFLKMRGAAASVGNRKKTRRAMRLRRVLSHALSTYPKEVFYTAQRIYTPSAVKPYYKGQI